MTRSVSTSSTDGQRIPGESRGPSVRSPDGRARLTLQQRPASVFVLLGVLAAGYFALTGTVWAVTGEFTRLGGQVLQLLGIDPTGWQYFETIHLEGSPIDRSDGWIVFGMLAGALAAALIMGDFKWRSPRLRRRLVQGFVGGIVAGFGARLAMGCNLAAMFTGIPQFSLHAWIFTITTAVGTWFGVKVIRLRAWRGPVAVRRVERAAPPLDRAAADRRKRMIGIAVAIIMAAVVVIYLVLGQYLLAVAATFGIAFGVLIQRGQICFTAAFRDLWISGRGSLAKALVLGLGASTILTFIAIQFGTAQIIQISSLGTVIGGLLFGFGIVIAGGCETGMMYRAMEGQVHYFPVFAGNIVGATILAFSWDHLGVYDLLVASGSKVNLVAEWGPGTALIASLIVLAICYAAIIWRERAAKRTGETLAVSKKETA